ncbi:MAG: alpha/beta fold hydrolase [Bacteroidota bacterium]
MHRNKTVKQANFSLLVILLFLFSCKANFQHLQKEENKYNVTITEQLKDENYTQKIEQFYEKGKEGTFTGKADIVIYYKIFKHNKEEKGAILISAGRTEAAIKYKEIIFDLYNNGYSVYIHDHRGQGLSGRMIDDPEMGYVDTFQFFIDDMKFFYDNMLKVANHEKVYLLAHSMGGAIGMTYIEQNPNDFNAAAFSSPMLGLVPPSCTAVKLFNSEEPKYALGESKYHDDKVAFEDNKLSGSEIRYNRMNAAFAKEPKARLGGATYQWVYKSCQQFDSMNNNIDKIQTPFILFSAENEQIVDVMAHQRFVEKAQAMGKLCVAYVVENAQHELLIEKDEQRIETINETLDFYSRY